MILSSKHLQLPTPALPEPTISINEYSVNFGSDLSEVRFQRLGVFEFAVRFRFLYEGLQEGFLFEERLEGVCNFRVGVDDLR